MTPGDNAGHMSAILKFCPLLIPGTIIIPGVTPSHPDTVMRGFVTIITRALSPAIIDWIGIDLPFTFVADPGKVCSLFVLF